MRRFLRLLTYAVLGIFAYIGIFTRDHPMLAIVILMLIGAVVFDPDIVGYFTMVAVGLAVSGWVGGAEAITRRFDAPHIRE